MRFQRIETLGITAAYQFLATLRSSTDVKNKSSAEHFLDQSLAVSSNPSASSARKHWARYHYPGLVEIFWRPFLACNKTASDILISKLNIR